MDFKNNHTFRFLDLTRTTKEAVSFIHENSWFEVNLISFIFTYVYRYLEFALYTVYFFLNIAASDFLLRRLRNQKHSFSLVADILLINWVKNQLPYTFSHGNS